MAVRETLIGIARNHGKPVRPAAALTSLEIKQLIASCAEDLPGLRDRALFLVGFAGAVRRSELVAIDRVHLRFAAYGVVIHIPRSKGDQAGRGADVTLPRMRGDDTCPVRALERWLRRARITRGPVFRGITTHGTIEGRLSADGVRKILLRRAALAKLTVHPSERLSPHGLRAGLITEAYLAGAPRRSGDAAHAACRSVHHARSPQAGPHHRRQPGPAARSVSGGGEQARSGLRPEPRQGRSPWNPDWLRNTLTVSGPAAAVARFRQAAAGTGAIPWQLDIEHEEARLLAPMAAAGMGGAAVGARTVRGDRGAARVGPGALVPSGALPARSAPSDPGVRSHPAAWRQFARGKNLAVDPLGYDAAAAPGPHCRRAGGSPPPTLGADGL